jgi:aryl-alcohol dehydrogenase-like predicted oxidoreductase
VPGHDDVRPWGNDDRADAIRVIHHALDAGINFVDTADVYSDGISEEIVGAALQGRRDDVVLATKFFMPMDDRPNHSGGSRKWIIQEVENSLRRLKTDHIDLYQVHRPSPTTDVEETLGALTDLVRQGKIRYIGSSSYSASQIVEAQWASRDRNLARFVTEQPRTRSWFAASRKTSSRPRSGTAWEPSYTARCPGDG